MFWITLGIGVVIGFALGIIMCALVIEKFVKDGKWELREKARWSLWWL